MSTIHYTSTNPRSLPNWIRIFANPEVDQVDLATIRLGHESLDVTLAYLKGKDAESEEARKHAQSISLALYP